LRPRSLLLAAVLLSLTACGRDDGSDHEPVTASVEPATSEEPTLAPVASGPPATLEEAASRVLGPDDAFIAMDPATGEIQALVNPDVGVRSVYPPGSTFKLIVAYAVLDEGLVGPHDEVPCSGTYSHGGTIHPCSVRAGHGQPSIVRALAESCNVFFYTQGSRLGAARMRRAVDDFGLLDPTGFDPAEPAGRWPEALEGERLALAGAGNLGDLQVTPLSMLVAFSGLVGDGQCHRPWRGEQDRGEVLASLPALFEYQALLVDGLEGAVEYGTATAAAVDGETLLGKTGTKARVDEPTATVNWFLGYLVERRLTACVVMTRASGMEPAAVAFGKIFASWPRTEAVEEEP
jgi:penicillin-binding protein A